MHVTDGKIALSKEDLDQIIELGKYSTRKHTEYFMNGITVGVDEFTIGLYGWLDGLDAYVGETKIIIKSLEHAKAFFELMDSMVKLNETC